MMIPRVTLISLSAAILTASPVAADPMPSTEQCAAAAAILAESDLGTQAWFSSAPPPAYTRGPISTESWSGASPDPTLLAALQAAPAKSALSCQNVSAAVAARGPIYSHADGQSRLRSLGIKGGEQRLYAIGLPVVKGNQAIAYVASSSNQLAGGLQVVALAKTATGAWKVASRKVLTIS